MKDGQENQGMDMNFLLNYLKRLESIQNQLYYLHMKLIILKVPNG